MSTKVTAVVLAAGQGKRMHSRLPKVLHPILGRPMIAYVLETAQLVTGGKPVLVIGHGGQAIREVVGEAADMVVQTTQLGTGHALQQVEPFLRGKTDLVLVTYGDMPLLSAQTLSRLIVMHRAAQAKRMVPVTMLTIQCEDPRGFGRVVRDANDEVMAIVEEAQATPEQLALSEYNPGVYCFNADWLWQALPQIPLSAQGEYYLTDVVGIAAADGLPVQTLQVDDPCQAIGINTRVHLAEAEIFLRRKINQDWMLAGVTMVDPERTYIEASVDIGQDTVIWPNSYLRGKTRIGEGCSIGPNTILVDTQLGDRCEVLESVLEGAIAEDEVEIGPFARLRKGAHLARGVHMGNFGEIKNSYLGPGSKMGHFSYVGDATIGAKVNIGAGTVTCNYDGKRKNHTEIGEGAFIGSDTMLVAPVKIGTGSVTGAGAVVTKDVADHTLAVGVPARSIRKLEADGG